MAEEMANLLKILVCNLGHDASPHALCAMPYGLCAMSLKSNAQKHISAMTDIRVFINPKSEIQNPKLSANAPSKTNHDIPCDSNAFLTSD
jgi:hypothetical protein